MDMSRDDRLCSDARSSNPREFRAEPPEDAERALLDEALGWVVRLKSGEATGADLDALRRWRDGSPTHEQAFREAARLWRRVGEAARELDKEERAARRAPSRSWRSAFSFLCASLGALAVEARAGKHRRRG